MDCVFIVTYALTIVECQNFSYKGEIFAANMYVFLDISMLNKKPNNSETLECVKEPYYAPQNKGPLIHRQG